MTTNFLFYVFLSGIVIATLQDLKRREVDNWLNLFLLVTSFSYIFYHAIFENNPFLISISFVVLITMFILKNLFYYGRVFGGGDAYLLFAMSAFFIGVTILESILNIGIFIILLMISGSVYGIIFSLVLYFKNFKKINIQIKKNISSYRLIFLISVLGIIFLIPGYFNLVFLPLSILFLTFPFLYVFSKSLENVSMVKTIPVKKLREGDWLYDDQVVDGKTIKSSWEGLSAKEIKLLSRKKKIKIKEGLPFVPAFLLAFILYELLRDWIFSLF
jgi:Flp pilus assembly protein protease CpaA